MKTQFPAVANIRYSIQLYFHNSENDILSYPPLAEKNHRGRWKMNVLWYLVSRQTSNYSPCNLIYTEITGGTQSRRGSIDSFPLNGGHADRFGRLRRFDGVAVGDNNLEIGVSANEIPITYGQRLLCNVYKQIVVGPAFPVNFRRRWNHRDQRRVGHLSSFRRTGHFRNYRLFALPLHQYGLFKRSVRTTILIALLSLSFFDKNSFEWLYNGLTLWSIREWEFSWRNKWDFFSLMYDLGSSEKWISILLSLKNEFCRFNVNMYNYNISPMIMLVTRKIRISEKFEYTEWSIFLNWKTIFFA